MNWLPKLRRRGVAFLALLLALIGQSTVVIHDVKAGHAVDAECELCLAMERTGDGLAAHPPVHPTQPGVEQSAPATVALIIGQASTTPLPRGPPLL